MTRDELISILRSGEYLKFDRVVTRRSQRPDLHAFLLLDEILPPRIGGNAQAAPDMISCAEHDQIWLAVNIDELAERVTREQAIELVRCGVRYSDDGLAMFV